MANKPSTRAPLIRAIHESGNDIPDLLTADEVGNLINKGAASIYGYINKGRLPAVREPVTGRWLVKKADLIAFVTPSDLQ